MTLRSMEPAGPGLEKIVAGSVRRAPAGQGPVFAWPIACGPAVSARTFALDFQQGILRVRVQDVGWRKELQALSAQYLAVINRYSSESVRRIEFVVGPNESPGESVPARRP
jgi:Dna[CI] antecedent, DciA